MQTRERYQSLRRIAVGGMAEIFVARETGLAGFQRLVVIKRLLPDLAERAEIVDLFLDEARIAAHLRHPNIVQIYELGNDGDGFFIAMELVDGHNLSRIVAAAKAAGEPVPRALAIHLVAELAR